MTIAQVMLVYFITEYLGGNGAIAALIFGIVLTNSRTLVFIGKKIMNPRKKIEMNAEDKKDQQAIVSRREKMFYMEIAFFLKTFFFVYIGLLLNVGNLKVVLMGTAIALSMMLLRSLVSCLTKSYKKLERVLINALFARGIAPAAIILTAVKKGVIEDQIIIDTVYFVITATIVLSSLKVFVYKRKIKKANCETA